MDNVLAKSMEQISKIEQVRELVETVFEDSFLFDAERLSLKKHDDEYNRFVTAVDIYNEFEKIDNKLSNKKNYSTHIMLEIMKELTGDRYRAFKNVYARKYKEQPGMNIEEYLDYFNDQMKKLGDKLEFGWYDKGFTQRVQEKVSKSLAETILYLKAIGQWKLADELMGYYTDPLTQPKLPKKAIAEIAVYHQHDMAKKCKIPQKEANRLIKNEIKKISRIFISP